MKWISSRWYLGYLSVWLRKSQIFMMPQPFWHGMIYSKFTPESSPITEYVTTTLINDDSQIFSFWTNFLTILNNKMSKHKISWDVFLYFRYVNTRSSNNNKKNNKSPIFVATLAIYLLVFTLFTMCLIRRNRRMNRRNVQHRKYFPLFLSLFLHNTTCCYQHNRSQLLSSFHLLSVRII